MGCSDLGRSDLGSIFYPLHCEIIQAESMDCTAANITWRIPTAVPLQSPRTGSWNSPPDSCLSATLRPPRLPPSTAHEPQCALRDSAEQHVILPNGNEALRYQVRGCDGHHEVKQDLPRSPESWCNGDLDSSGHIFAVEEYYAVFSPFDLPVTQVFLQTCTWQESVGFCQDLETSCGFRRRPRRI
jgi:hypothetical protein